MKLNTLFPTVVAEDSVMLSTESKDRCMNEVFSYLSETGFSNESTRHVDLQCNPQLRELYSGITRSVEQYLHTLCVDLSKININIIKSWLNIVEAQHTPLHAHGEAHYSFAYYLNVPSHYSQYIEFIKEDKHPSEPFRGFFQNHVFNWDTGNCIGYSILPREETLVIFPSDLSHRTGGDGVQGDYLEKPVTSLEQLYNKRVCIAGDIILTYKNTEASFAGIQPVCNWRTFS